jgi:ligand-binding SRPBCC domain-containing protein
MRYLHRFRINAPLSSVAAFHQQPTSMGSITPPPIWVEIHHAPAVIFQGSQMDFSLRFGLFRLNWIARFEDVSSHGFTDRQLSGPFAEWVHRHTFVEVNDKVTEVVDEIDLTLRLNPFWWLFGMAMWLSLPILFAYRQWKTRRILQ